MTDPVRKHCAEILQLWDADCDMDSAMEHLRGLIAHPEPASAASDIRFEFSVFNDGTDYRALCADLLKGLDENRHPEVRYPGHLRIIMDRARTALDCSHRARPVAEESSVAQPAEGEVAELVESLLEESAEDEIHNHMRVMNRPTIRRIAALLQRHQPPQPVAVSERLPGPTEF